jgi:DNA-binding winged helix-turn-helix (wHTH) protein
MKARPKIGQAGRRRCKSSQPRQIIREEHGMNDMALQTMEPGYWLPLASRVAPRDAARTTEPPMAFGPFVVLPACRSLLCRGLPVPIGSRAFDLLMVLLRSQGTIVTKADIVRQVWPSMIVEEGNLRLQIVMLRRALGPERDRIKTVPGRGYLFAADASEEPGSRALRSGAPPIQGWTDQAISADNPTLVIVGATQEVCDALHGLLRSLGLRVAAFASVQALLESQ